MSKRDQSSTSTAPLMASFAALGLLLLSGCGLGTIASSNSLASDNIVSNPMGGILHGGPNPIVGATITLWVTNNGSYGAAATNVTHTTSDTGGNFTFTLPTTSVVCPSGQYAYVTAYGGNTGSYVNSNPATASNTASLLLVPIGLCDTYYSFTSSGSGASTVYTNAYSGQSLWIDEITTAVSAYALGNFMKVSSDGTVNIGGPLNNTSTSSASTPSAAGLAHAFANALAIINNHTGQPNATYTPVGKSSTGGIVPQAEIFTLGNILQACVNSAGPTGTNTSIANDGSGCGKLFSYTTPPQTHAAVPVNTLQAMQNLATYPASSVNTWDSTCTTAGTGTVTGTQCIFNLATGFSAYPNGLDGVVATGTSPTSTGVPSDWALAITYTSGTGVNTTATACTTAGTCPGLTYPFNIALDYQDNVFVLNYDAFVTTGLGNAKTWTNIVGIAFDGTPLIATPKDTTNLFIRMIGTDTATHVFGINNASSSGALKVYSTTTSAAAVASSASTGATPQAVIADPLNNIYASSTSSGVNLRKFAYGGTQATPTYTVSSLVAAPAGSAYQLGFDSKLNLFIYTSTPAAYVLPNSSTVTAGTPSAPTFGAMSGAATITGNASNSFGIGVTSTGVGLAVSSTGLTPITYTPATTGPPATVQSISAGTAITVPPVISGGGLYLRGVAVDGSNNLISADGNGGTLSGVTVYDYTDNLALGNYKGCFVTSKECSLSTSNGSPIFSPRGAAVDSAGDIWVVSGASAALTELIGAAAPTWPGLSMGLTGLPK